MDKVIIEISDYSFENMSTLSQHTALAFSYSARVTGVGELEGTCELTGFSTLAALASRDGCEES